MSAALDLQKAIRGRLVSTPTVTALVPASAIFDRHKRPEVFPCIVLGEDQEVADDITLQRQHVRVIATLHLWQREPDLTGVKAIAGAIRTAVAGWRPSLDSHHAIDFRYEGARFVRDPDGETAHGIVTLEALVGVLQ